MVPEVQQAVHVTTKGPSQQWNGGNLLNQQFRFGEERPKSTALRRFFETAACTSVGGAHSAHVTGVAEEMGIQGEALRSGLIRQALATLLREEVKNKSKTRVFKMLCFSVYMETEFSNFHTGIRFQELQKPFLCWLRPKQK